MALRDEIVPFVDGNNLVAPNAQSGVGKGSDNGPMYTSEYYVMLKMLGQLVDQDLSDFQARIGQCVNPQGMLCRVPIGQDDGQEQVDDYYGTLNGCKQLGNTKIPRQYLMGMWNYIGFMDNEHPGAHEWASFMPRQLQLVAACVAAAFPSWKNPLHILVRSLFAPLFWFTAIIIATSCWGVDPGNTDARRLSWHLLQTVKSVSPLCWLASKIWYKRLYKAYGSDGMKAVANIYYQPGHPFAKYWVD